MDTLKSLPKDYAIYIGLKVLLALLAVFTLGGLLVFATVAILYTNQAELWVIILSAWATWIIYIAIFIGLHYLKKAEIKNKTAILHTLANQKVLASIAIFSVKNFLRKFHKTRSARAPADEN